MQGGTLHLFQSESQHLTQCLVQSRGSGNKWLNAQNRDPHGWCCERAGIQEPTWSAISECLQCQGYIYQALGQVPGIKSEGGRPHLQGISRSTERALGSNLPCGLRSLGMFSGGKGACNRRRKLEAPGGVKEREDSQLWALGQPDKAPALGKDGPQECVFRRGEGDGDHTGVEMRLTQPGQLPENSVQSTRETHLRKQNCESNFEALVAMGTYL